MLVCAAGSPVCYGRQTPYFLAQASHRRINVRAKKVVGMAL
jgi:hypothetical protein